MTIGQANLDPAGLVMLDDDGKVKIRTTDDCDDCACGEHVCCECYDCCYGDLDTISCHVHREAIVYDHSLPECGVCLLHFPGFDRTEIYDYIGCGDCGSCNMCCATFLLRGYNPDSELCESMPFRLDRCCETGIWTPIFKPGFGQTVCSLACDQSITIEGCESICNCLQTIPPPVCHWLVIPSGCGGGSYQCITESKLELDEDDFCQCVDPKDIKYIDIDVNVITCHLDPEAGPEDNCTGTSCLSGAGDIPDPPPPDVGDCPGRDPCDVSCGPRIIMVIPAFNITFEGCTYPFPGDTIQLFKVSSPCIYTGQWDDFVYRDGGCPTDPLPDDLYELTINIIYTCTGGGGIAHKWRGRLDLNFGGLCNTSWYFEFDTISSPSECFAFGDHPLSFGLATPCFGDVPAFVHVEG